MALAWKAGWVQALAGSNPASSASLTRPFSLRSWERTVPRLPSGLSFGLSCLRCPGVVGSSGPDESVNTGSHFMADRVGDVLVAGSHRGAGPAHDPHHRPLGNTED